MKEITPTATFMSATDEPIKTIYRAYRRCYSAEAGLPRAQNYDEMLDFIRKMVKAEHAHESPLEHVSLTFHITCSRAASHQFVRHRLASYSQQSQRYVTTKGLPYVMPLDFLQHALRRFVFKAAMAMSQAAYWLEIKLGAKSEDARSVLPNATATHLVVTMNCRQLRHFFAERTCNRAQEEIRSIADQMLMYAKTVVPGVFDNAGPLCMQLKHCPEPIPCGRNPWKNAN